MITYIKKNKDSNVLQVIANKAGIKFTTSGTSEFAYDEWVELEGHRLSKKALNRFAWGIIKECEARVEKYLAECEDISVLPKAVLDFESGE